MLRSNINTDFSDFNKIKIQPHIEKVWEKINKNIELYFNHILSIDSKLKSLTDNTEFKVSSSKPDSRLILAEIFQQGLNSYLKDEPKYSRFFSDESLQEFEDEDDVKAFKSALGSKVPVIVNARNSKRPTMQEWQERFATSKADDIYSIFFNLINFMNEFIENIDSEIYLNINDLDELDMLCILNEDEDYNVPGVIGMGIKSSILYFLNPEYFLGATKNTLYGFYFLSECDHFGLPSQSSEFIMINDMKLESAKRFNINLLIDQNYWYPYDLFIYYGLKSYDRIKELCSQYNYHLDDKYRFVHLNTFMSQIWEKEYDKIKTMMGGDQNMNEAR